MTRYETRYGISVLLGRIHIDWVYRNPKPIAQIEDELIRAKKAHDDFVNSWFDLKDLAKVFLLFKKVMTLNLYLCGLQETCNALLVRCDRWLRFRTAVTVQLRNQFMYNLSLRGYLGMMEVDHEDGTIELRVCL